MGHDFTVHIAGWVGPFALGFIVGVVVAIIGCAAAFARGMSGAP